MLPLCPHRSRFLAQGGFFALALLFALHGSASAFVPPDLTVAVSPDVAPTDADGRIPLIVETRDASALAARVAELGGRVTHVFENIDAIAFTLPSGAVSALVEDDRIDRIQRQRLVRRATVPARMPDRPGAGLRVPAAGSDILALPGGPAGRRIRTLRPDDFPAARAAGGSGPMSFFGYDVITGAAESWEATGYGEGTIVAIIDTGIYPQHPMLDGSVLGGMNLVPAEEEHGIDHDGDGTADGRDFDWDALQNHDHGTFVGGLVAGHAELWMEEGDDFLRSLLEHTPESVELDEEGNGTVRLLGTAPSAKLYGIKVFPYDGGNAPDARVAAAIDRLITMKRRGELDTDVINMSLSGPVLFDGWNPLDLIVNRATFAGITVVSAASNDGPSLITVGSPASAFSGLAAGGALDPLHTRVAVEVGFGLPVGLGSVAFPAENPMIVSFSSRGLTADGRVKPSLVATGFFLFSSSVVDFSGDGLNDTPFFGFGSGTSFSTPTIAGAAALVTAFGDRIGRFGRAPFVANALRKAAVPIEDFELVSQRAQGRGFVHVPGALELMESGRVWFGGLPDPSHAQMERLVLGSAVHGQSPALAPGISYDFLVEVPRGVSNLSFEITDVSVSLLANPIFGEAVEVAVHSAKRGGAGDYVFFADLAEVGMSVDIPYPEPGTMRVTMSGFPANYGEASAAFSMTADRDAIPVDRELSGVLRRDGIVTHVVDVPENLDAVAVRLSWRHDWTRYPTYDLDLFIENADGALPVASIDSPELAWIEAPAGGEWTFTIADIGTIRRREPYDLEIAFLEKPPIRIEMDVDPERPRLLAATPNPARSHTGLRFVVPREERVQLRVFDVTGRLVRTLVDGRMVPGQHEIRWDGRGNGGRRAAAGVYFLRLDSGAGSSTRKVTMLK